MLFIFGEHNNINTLEIIIGYILNKHKIVIHVEM